MDTHIPLMIMDEIPLLSFCSIYLFTVLVHLLKRRFFWTKPSGIDRVDVCMRATILAIYPNEHIIREIQTVAWYMYNDITGIIKPIYSAVSDLITEVSNMMITMSNVTTPDIIYWIIILAIVVVIFVFGFSMIIELIIGSIMFLCRFGTSSILRQPPQTPVTCVRLSKTGKVTRTFF